LFTPYGNIGQSSSDRGSHDDFDDDKDEEHESEEDGFPGEITHEGNKIQAMKSEWREIATVEDRCYIDGIGLVDGLTDRTSFQKETTLPSNGLQQKKHFLVH